MLHSLVYIKLQLENCSDQWPQTAVLFFPVSFREHFEDLLALLNAG